MKPKKAIYSLALAGQLTNSSVGSVRNLQKKGWVKPSIEFDDLILLRLHRIFYELGVSKLELDRILDERNILKNGFNANDMLMILPDKTVDIKEMKIAEDNSFEIVISENKTLNWEFDCKDEIFNFDIEIKGFHNFTISFQIISIKGIKENLIEKIKTSEIPDRDIEIKLMYAKCA